MAQENHTLRSGGARGADTAFESGCDAGSGWKEIYLPYAGFNKNQSPLFEVTTEARKLARLFHPKWELLGNVGRDFMGRNCYQVLGKDLRTPTDFIICWTEGGKIKGGTGQALRMAEHYHIPVFNMGGGSLLELESELLPFLEKHKDT